MVVRLQAVRAVQAFQRWLEQSEATRKGQGWHRTSWRVRWLLPLLGGEGRGEGEPSHHLPSAATVDSHLAPLKTAENFKPQRN